MANRREIKKEINQLSWELINECITYRDFHANVSAEEVNNIIQCILDVRNDLITRLNSLPKKEGRKAVKDHYRLLLNDQKKMVSCMDKLPKE